MIQKENTISISAQNIGKRFEREWIFRKLSCDFCSTNPTAIVGSNGSGKSTFIKTLIGYLPLSEGKLVYSEKNIPILKENWQSTISWAAPYTELIEEFTLLEQLKFHKSFKPFDIEIEEIIEKLGFSNTKSKTIRFFSSGMKQKLKLALAIYSNAKIVFLDEPTSNLDKQNSEWYLQEINTIIDKKVLIIASNQPSEYHFCSQIIDIQNLKL
ncbi:ABC transporter ATP-binding protein [Bernardetia litoralis]|uniref:ABC transporter ATP-binding protein n=1 Tax=Bernardetia litoralis TaxID=999 RepID=UPI0002DB791C|nr:ATP-binding cassette domain-containing protein [Bernardetia litoralis]